MTRDARIRHAVTLLTQLGYVVTPPPPGFKPPAGPGAAPHLDPTANQQAALVSKTHVVGKGN